MAIVENRSSELGDVMIIRAEVPAVGIVTLASFIDSTINETGTALFTKEFRYALDGVNFTPFMALTNPNLADITFTPTDIFLVEYRYTRAGTDPLPPDLEFNSVELTGTFTATTCGESYSNSIFAQFFSCTDACVLGWMINVLEKMYKEGTIPKYIERGNQHNDGRQDQDYLEFWKNIAQYFAYIVCYARQWELTSSTANYDILIEYLRNQTFLFCGKENIDDLIYIMNNSYDEIRHRGTFEIIKTKADGRDVDGEWHRLYCHLSKCTDWYFSAVFNYKIGWVGDSASPLYKGNYRDNNLNKAYEDTEEVVDLGNYPLINSGNIIIETDTVNNGDPVDVLKINAVAASETSGIGREETLVEDTGSLIKVSTKCDYEISFWVKEKDLDNIFTFIVDCYDTNGNLLPKATVSAYFNITSNRFLEKQIFPRSDKYYYVRGIIYSINHRWKPGEDATDYLTNVPPSFSTAWLQDPNLVHDRDYQFLRQNSLTVQSALRFKTNAVCYIEPRIILDNEKEVDISGTIVVYDVKVRQLGTVYSTGFEQSTSFIKASVENFNLDYSNAQADEKVREFLIPYKNTIKNSYLNPSESTTVDDALDVILDTDERITTPTFQNSGILPGDRYLVWVTGSKELELQEFDGSVWNVSVDNAQGNKIFVANKKVVYAYDNDKWNFSSK